MQLISGDRLVLLSLLTLSLAGSFKWTEAMQDEESSSSDDLNRLHVGDMASEILARSTSTSQVLSLNLSNLGILLLLKTLIFGAFYLTGDKYHKARSLDEAGGEILSEQEVLLILAFLMGDAQQDYTCLQRIACQDPGKSKKYLIAAKALVKGAQIFDGLISLDTKYEKLVSELEEAVTFGTKYRSEQGGSCPQRYSCTLKHSSSSTNQ